MTTSEATEKKPLWLLFVDMEKAYDAVWRQGLIWLLLQRPGLSRRFVHAEARVTDHQLHPVLKNGIGRL